MLQVNAAVEAKQRPARNGLAKEGKAGRISFGVVQQAGRVSKLEHRLLSFNSRFTVNVQHSQCHLLLIPNSSS